MRRKRVKVTRSLVGNFLDVIIPERVDKPENTKTLFVWDGNGGRYYNNWRRRIIRRPQSGHPKYTRFIGGTIETQRNNIPPIIEDGILVATIDMETDGDHCEWKVWHPDLIVKTYLEQSETYRWDFTCRLATLDRVKQYPKSHVTWFQCWGPSNRGNPSLALQYYRDSYRIQSYGGDYSRDHRDDNSVELNLKIDDDWHEWTVEYKPDPIYGSLKVWLDMELVKEVSGPTCYHETSSRKNWAGQNRFGCYTPPTREPCTMEFSHVEMMKMV